MVNDTLGDELKKVVFVDLDSTLCDTRHRWWLIEERREQNGEMTPDDWRDYSMLCENDIPIFGTVQLVRTLAQAGIIIVILSARMDDSAVETTNWLAKHHVPFHDIVLKNISQEYMSNGEWKVTMMLDWLNSHAGYEVVMMIDDLPEISAKLLEVGIPTLLVNPAYGNTPRKEEIEGTHANPEDHQAWLEKQKSNA